MNCIKNEHTKNEIIKNERIKNEHIKNELIKKRTDPVYRMAYSANISVLYTIHTQYIYRKAYSANILVLYNIQYIGWPTLQIFKCYTTYRI